MAERDITKFNKEELTSLAIKFDGEFSDNAKLRTVKEDELLENLRQSKGVHDPLIHNALKDEDSKIYAQYTRSKEVPLRSKLNEHLIPEREKNWEINPSPKPRVPEEKLQGIITPLITADQSGKHIFPSQNEIDAAISHYTTERSDRMETTIFKQLSEMNYNGLNRESIKSGVRYGTGIKKGPTTIPYKEVETVFEEGGGVVTGVVKFLKRFVSSGIQPSGKWVQKETTKYRPGGESVSIWRFFPDMNAVEPEKMGFIYELHSMTKHEMRKMAKREDFFGDVIIKILEDEPTGNYRPRSWETNLQALQKDQQAPKPNTYEVYERNGYIDGTALFQAGIIEEDKADREYFCSFWICEKKCIRITTWPEEVFPTLLDLYHIFYYEKDETSILGTGLPRIIRHRQLAINAGNRNLLGHAAWLKAPCGEVNISLIHPDAENDADKFGPGYFIPTNAPNGTTGKVLSIYNVEDRVASLIRVLDYQRQQGDLESSLPSQIFSQPESSGDETAKGVAVRLQSVLDFIKDLARNFDSSNVSFIRSVYRWNMAYNPDEEIKGDMDVQAVGSVQALIKDAIREQVGFFMQSLPDWVQEYVNKEEFAKQLFKSMFDDYQKLVLTEEQVQKNRIPAQKKQQEIDDLQKQLMQVKAEYDKAKAENMQSKSELTKAKIPHVADEAAIKNAKATQELGMNEIKAEQGKSEIVSKNLENLHSQHDIVQKVMGVGDGQAEPGA